MEKGKDFRFVIDEGFDENFCLTIATIEFYALSRCRIGATKSTNPPSLRGDVLSLSKGVRRTRKQSFLDAKRELRLKASQ